LADPQWPNTTVLGGEPCTVRELKEQPGQDIVLTGSVTSATLPLVSASVTDHPAGDQARMMDTEASKGVRAGLPDVISATRLSNSFLGNVIEVCFATEDCERTMAGMTRLGMGPWRVYTFDATTVEDRVLGGRPADWELRVAFADVGGTAMEIMQPLRGSSIIRQFLDAHGEGIHHIAFDCENLAWDERQREFADRGFPCSQAGRFASGNSFAFFDDETATTTTFETYRMPADFVWPPPDEWFPSPPPG